MAFDEHRHIQLDPIAQDTSEEVKVRSEILRTSDRIGEVLSRMERMVEMDMQNTHAAPQSSVSYLDHFRAEHFKSEEAMFKVKHDRRKAQLKSKINRLRAMKIQCSTFISLVLLQTALTWNLTI
jgi:hypothetical protein